ncbi:30S ribosome-binding factor RbfA [Kushneria phosphatilytica]|uniref:Ribosome-binding factor A n=1 Tax=Kushneria phosphatilytica TaxID=657387 RepID=A0A1S1NW78_9GAMM|nr:30S ribosome-binding factor RbfA [Kushneria phosphatilytica]OHV11238.1 ribosome-binding factor A [Kushneria phosphatilytica]QEL12186.1 30S ribosome-binding factor RbfA [Kushneria phosphatilytica]
MREFSRTDRVAEQLAHELAVLIQREVKDPRLGMVTVGSARVSRDLSYADVYITLMGDNSDERIRDHLRILEGASGFLRRRLGQQLKLRHVPQLRFHYDDSVERGHALSSLIDEAVATDQRRHDEDDGAVDPDSEPREER